jgi:hypothetical protein
MPLAGAQLMPRQVADHAALHWRGHELVKAVATALAESQGCAGAWHDNLDQQGVVVSRDCGVWQINIPESDIGSAIEFQLRSVDPDPKVYGPVVTYNAYNAYVLYEQAWTRDGLPDKRRWQPWVSYTEGWATFAAWWQWHGLNGWAPTGRYLQRAIAGVANYHLVIAQNKTLEEALIYATDEAAHWGVAGTVYAEDGIVKWNVPPEPSAPPANGVGPEPVPNDGV